MSDRNFFPANEDDRLDRARIRKMFDEIKEPPGPPYYDDTMNFLDASYHKTKGSIGKLVDRKLKLEREIQAEEEELEKTQDLLIKEYRDRHIANPETGEVIPEPFSE